MIVALATDEPHRFNRIVKRAHRRFSREGGSASEFKFNRSGERLRRFFLEGVSDIECWIVWGATSKDGAAKRSLADKDAQWQYTASRTMAEMSRRILTREWHVVVDRRSLTRLAREQISNRFQWEIMRHHAGHFPPSVTTSHLDSGCTPGLQVADHIAGAMFLSLERNQSSYLRHVECRILHGELYW